jgi:hypothetical protein
LSEEADAADGQLHVQAKFVAAAAHCSAAIGAAKEAAALKSAAVIVAH